MSRAAKAAGISRKAAYLAREADPDFASAWDDTLAASVDDLEEQAFLRGKHESDTLAIFLLKAHRPHVYNVPTKVAHQFADDLEQFLPSYVDPRHPGEDPARPPSPPDG